MNPIIPILLVFGGVLAWSMFKTAKAVVNLNYTITRFGIYRFATDGNLVFRLRVRFTNAQNTTLTVNMMDIAAYLNSTTYYDANGQLRVSNKGNLLAAYQDATPFVIQPNSFTDKDFLIPVRWADIGRYFLLNIVSIVTDILNANNISEYVSAIVGRNVLITGLIKAENVSIAVNNIVTITDDRNS